jgi:trk system potassium uptake protein TrkH
MRNQFQTLHSVFHVLASLFILFSVVLLLPLVIVMLYREWTENLLTVFAFSCPAVLSLCIGLIFRSAFKRGNPGTLQSMLICVVGWLGFSAIGAIPFVIGIHVSYLDGFFETMSGFTTTGITMFTKLESLPRSILFWRALTQWIGGLGILTFFLVIIRGGGGKHHLFGAESHKIEVDRPVPGMTHTIKVLWILYLLFSGLIILALIAANMSVFDSVCHAFTALSTGGFSPHDLSIEYYRITGHPHAIWIEYILIAGMILGGMNFLVHYRVLKGDVKAIFDTTEMNYWWGIITFFVLVILAERFCKLHALSHVPPFTSEWMLQIEENFRLVLFQVISIITTTGFATQDIGSAFFGHVARQLFLVMMVIGGCVGSTGGGIKILRVAILIKLIRHEIFRLRSPVKTVSTILIDGKPLGSHEVYRVAGLFFTWIVLLVLGGSITALLSQLNALQAFSGMFSALGNIGPCYIPYEQNSQLHPVIKLVYIFGMLAGRLEILPVLLFFSPKAWRS